MPTENLLLTSLEANKLAAIMFYTSVPSVYDQEKVEAVLQTVNRSRQLLKNIDAVLMGEMLLDVDMNTDEIIFTPPTSTRDKLCLVAIINEYDGEGAAETDDHGHSEN